MTSIPCFFLEATERQRLSLRRYSYSPRHRQSDACPLRPGQYSYHDIKVAIGEAPIVRSERGTIAMCEEREPAHDDPRWPTHCACGYAFKPEDEWQLFTEQIYTRVDTGEDITLRDAPAGALYYAWWMEDREWNEWIGPDGHVLMCKTPGGDWNIDSRASNCTMPGDNTHRCWVRHGDPRDPQGKKSGQPLHVDKNGNTCSAGAGSILCGSYHGFLHGGHLVSC